jgi:hypothetical protein
MAEGPLILRDLSACCYDSRRGGDGPIRLRAMGMLVAREDPEKNGGIRHLAAYPQSFAGCLAAVYCGL